MGLLLIRTGEEVELAEGLVIFHSSEKVASLSIEMIRHKCMFANMRGHCFVV